MKPLSKSFSRFLFAALCHYVFDHLRPWDKTIDTLTYAYDTQPPTDSSFALFDVVLERPPPLMVSKARNFLMCEHNSRQ